jgi:hypothetical protein
MKKLILFALLLCAAPAWAQRTDPTSNCGTAGSTSLGQSWTLSVNACGGQTADITQSSTETFSYGVVSGQLVVAFLGGCDTQSAAGGCSGGPFTASPIWATEADGNVAAEGTVNISGSAMTLASGDGWGMDGCNWGACKWAGATITVNGSSCTLVTPISLTTATVSGCGTGSGLSYVGPVGTMACTDTGNAPGEQEAMCWGTATATDSGDSFTAHGASSNPPYSLAIVVTAVSNSSGNHSLDAAACNLANCAPIFQQLSNGATAVSMNLSTTGEIVFIGSVFQTGPAYVATGWNRLIMGASGATHSDNSCDTAGYCTNQVQTSVSTFSSSGQIYGTENTTTSDDALVNAVAFTSGTAAYGVPTGHVILNTQCWHSSSTSYCGSGGTPGGPMGFPLTNPSVVVLQEYYSSGTPTAPKFGGTTMTDCGPGAIALSGAHIRCYYLSNTTNNTESAITFTTYPQWYEIYEIGGVPSSSPIDGGSGVGYYQHASASSGSGGSTTSGSVTTATNGDIVLGSFGYSNGPPGSPGSGFAWIDPVFALENGGGAPVGEYQNQTTAGAINPGATDCNGASGCPPGAGTSGDAYAGITLALKPAASSTVVRHRAWVIQ